eukprot:41622-Rhodomonas_salina.1
MAESKAIPVQRVPARRVKGIDSGVCTCRYVQQYCPGSLYNHVHALVTKREFKKVCSALDPRP